MAAVKVDITMVTDTHARASLGLFQLISPSLPTGAFTYSQGLEWAVECGWVHDSRTLVQWLGSLLHSNGAELEIPVLRELYTAAAGRDLAGFCSWCTYLTACRETKELRDEEINRGKAMAKLLKDLNIETDLKWLASVKGCQAAGFALAAVHWQIPLPEAALGYLWSWLENMVMTAIKCVPLGQTDGQRSLLELHRSCQGAVELGLALNREDIGGSCPAFAIASSLHETQYTRLFRS